MNARLLGFYNWFLRPIPFLVFERLKIAYLRLCGVDLGQNIRLSPDVTVRGHGELSIGERTILAQGACIECLGGIIRIGDRCEVNHGTLVAANCGSQITIGNDVHIAHNCSIKGSTHNIDLSDDGKSIAGKSRFLNITIGDGSWLCAGVVVLPGVSVGKKNVLAAGTVVTKDTPDYVLMAGIPAQVKKRYFEGNDV